MMEVSSFWDLLLIIGYVLVTGFFCVAAAMFISKFVEPDREERYEYRRRNKDLSQSELYKGWERKRKWRFFWACLIVGIIVAYLLELEIIQMWNS